MAKCVIHPIPIVEGKFDKSIMTYRMNFAQPVISVTYVWFIEGPKQVILVDTGASAEYMGKMAAIKGEGTKEIQTLAAGLKKLGLEYGDVDTVILTHLHHDHIAEAAKFPRAKLLVQKKELEFARNPHPMFAASLHFFREYLKDVKFDVLSGDTTICDEVSVILTPGHSPGTQSVAIKTARGTAIIAGACTIRENFEPHGGGLPVIPPGIHLDACEAYDSLLKIKKMADIVIPLHDVEFLHVSTIP